MNTRHLTEADWKSIREKHAAMKPELKSKPAVLYFLELNDIDGTKFYKVGITINLRSRYYNFIKNNGGKVCWIVNGSLYECFLREQNILKMNTDFKYIPKLCMSGKSECLSKEVKNGF